MLFHWLLLCGRSIDSTVSLLPVSSQTVLSSVKPWAITIAGWGPTAAQGTVTSTENGMPSKPGTVPRHRT